MVYKSRIRLKTTKANETNEINDSNKIIFIRRIIYKFLNVRPFDNTAFAVSGKVGIP